MVVVAVISWRCQFLLYVERALIWVEAAEIPDAAALEDSNTLQQVTKPSKDACGSREMLHKVFLMYAHQQDHLNLCCCTGGAVTRA